MTSIGVTRVCNPTPHPCHQEAVGGSVTGPDDADYKVAINRLDGLAFIAIHSPWSSEYSRVRMCTLQPLPVDAVRIEVIKDWPTHRQSGGILMHSFRDDPSLQFGRKTDTLTPTGEILTCSCGYKTPI